MAARKLLSVGQLPLFNNSLNCLNALKKDYSNKKVLQYMGVPPKPKRPPTPYLTFQVAQRDEVIAKNPGKTFGEISKILGAKWNNMSETEKNKYREGFADKLASYKSQMEEYHRTHGNIPKKSLKELQDSVSSLKEGKRMLKMLEKENNKPEFPNTPYKYFIQERISKMDLPVKDRMQKCAELWRNMSEREKENFTRMYQQKYEQYKRELYKWEENMIRQGKKQLVRPDTLREKFSNK